MGNVPPEYEKESQGKPTTQKEKNFESKAIDVNYDLSNHLPQEHVSSHQPILKIHTANSQVFSTDEEDPLFSKRIQHGHYFLTPDLASVIKEGQPPPQCDKSFYYVRPSQGAVKNDMNRHKKLVYFVKKPSKKALRKNELNQNSTSSPSPSLSDLKSSSSSSSSTDPNQNNSPTLQNQNSLDEISSQSLNNQNQQNLAGNQQMLSSDSPGHQHHHRERKEPDWDPLDPCALCEDAPSNPLSAPCKHIACRECWLTWVHEMSAEGDEPFCPVCDEPVTLDTLQTVEACGFCERPLISEVDAWTPLCGHKGCTECWLDMDPENGKCPVCSTNVDTTVLHQTQNEL